jgi:two-component system chemotaxis response regulator CheB
MPKMDGLTFIEEVVKQEKLVPIIVVSSFSQEGTKLVLDALENGALDFVPISQANPEKTSQLKENLISKIEIASKSDPYQLIIQNIKKLKPRTTHTISNEASRRVIVIGSSTGGPKVVQSIISSLPRDITAGILVVQHMPQDFTEAFAKRLDDSSELSVKEAKDGDMVRNGTVLVAPGDYHMIIDNEKKIKLVTGPKRFGVRPAVNMTMVSAAEVYGINTVGVILTGMGHDGGFGMKTIKKRGGKTIAQDSTTAVVYGMPKAAIELNAVDQSLPTDKIPTAILEEIEKLVR